MSPVDICTDPSNSSSNLAIVPLPAPGAPNNIILIFSLAKLNIECCKLRRL
jgi:hypothetical protein